MMFWSKKKINYAEELNNIYSKLTQIYDENKISQERKTYLQNEVKKYGYLPYPYFKALDELTDEETLFALKEKWIANGVFKENSFQFDNPSILARKGIDNSDWIKREGHNIKLINLAGLGNRQNEAGKFMDWLKQLLILPTGNSDNNILSTTIYLIPFHPREFGCAYLPKSSGVSKQLLDSDLQEKTGLDAKEQVKLFIKLSQLAGHPVIYDILPQTGRFSKAVLANPSIARWYDVIKLQQDLDKKIEDVAQTMSENYDSEDINVIKDIYKRSDSAGDLSEYYQNIYDEFEKNMLEFKKELSNLMMNKQSQIQIAKRVKTVVASVENTKSDKIKTENDITKQLDVIQELMKSGLWPAPGGAWCSAGVPVYDKMSECGSYPVFRHFDYKGEDVTHFANLDCQTPYYFTYLENGTLNNNVIDYFINHVLNMQQEYNFDGFRFDHIDHIVDKVSEKEGIPISYRIPKTVLGKLNTTLKEKTPYLATLAEYMLWDNYYKEYHNDMKFDLLWGNDIVAQFDKTPQKIVDDNQYLTNYNVKQKSMLSILKTYNNQDGEFGCINQYPGQLGENGAIFKWFKYKFLPGGKFAQRSMLYVDGDESFTTGGIEHAIGEEVSMKRAKNEDFYNKFNAIDNFVKNNSVITDGEAQIILQDDDGFVAWLITKEPLKIAYLVCANYKYPTENVCPNESEWVNSESIYDKSVNLPGDYSVVCEYVLKDNSFEKMEISDHNIHFDELKPSQFHVFELSR